RDCWRRGLLSRNCWAAEILGHRNVWVNTGCEDGILGFFTDVAPFRQINNHPRVNLQNCGDRYRFLFGKIVILHPRREMFQRSIEIEPVINKWVYKQFLSGVLLLVLVTNNGGVYLSRCQSVLR